ncbi:MAG: energy-coupling factor ABC transporter permease [Deltaproteobacteria bacterium]|nr:energy-coupling factor ABC transporter permease [Deltaproteobacteria bacterium]
MHITEGIITGSAAIIYTGVGFALVGVGASRMKKFVQQFPDKKPLLGMGGALIFFISLIPIPAFTGTCSHPCGTPLVAILLGPWIGIALAGVSLLLQAAFFAHGGFGTWGANVVSLGFFGCVFGWGSFKLARKLGLPLWAAGFAGGLIGDIMVYVVSGLILGTVLSTAPNPQFSISGYLLAIYAAYLPTQLPIAIGEMLVTGMALHYACNQRPDVLAELGIIGAAKAAHSIKLSVFVLLLVSAAWSLMTPPSGFAGDDKVQPPPTHPASLNETSEEIAKFSGMDESVNEKFAEAAGRPPRDPYINTEKMGDLWNLLLLSAGAVCGFIFGRWWHLLWGDRKRRAPNRKSPQESMGHGPS